MLDTQVCIVGAGPGGAATALKLSYLGIPCILIDKSVFPRDKVCGDAISGKVTTLLNRLDPEIMQRFRALPTQIGVWGICFIAPGRRELRLPFAVDYSQTDAPPPGYVARRLDFDDFLIQEIKRRDNIQFFDNTAIEGFERTEEHWIVRDKSGAFAVRAPLLIIANGAHSAFSRKIAGHEKDPKHHAGAVRAYFKNVRNTDSDNFIELHFLKQLVPGYFWIFPLPGGYANVGLGMRSDIISKKRLNLRKKLLEVIESHPPFRERFQDAELVGEIVGYGLPLGSKKRLLSGDGYMLVGDAAHLIDPLTGEGIGNAFYSGFIAAEQAQQCLDQHNFSASFLQAYDVRVQRVLGVEMQLSYRLQRLMAYPLLVNVVTGIIGGNKRAMDMLSQMYHDLEVRRSLAKPWFWMKMFFNGK